MDQPEKTNITISSHNVNGYSRSKEFLHSLCSQAPNAIRAIQEHWLRPPYKKQHGVNQLRNLHPDFDGFGTSAMKNSTEKKVNIGRPFGGTGFIYSKKFSKCLKPLLSYTHDRVTVMELSSQPHRILLINAYMPFFNSRDISTNLSLYRDTVGFIDNIMCQNSDCKFILLADLNCNIYDLSHCYTKLIRDLMEKHRLLSTFDLVDNFDYLSSYTRFENKTNSRTLIDGILISDDLRHMVSDIRIAQYGNNVSDHLPVELTLNATITVAEPLKQKMEPFINWAKLSQDDLDIFEQKLTEGLNSINIPSAVFHGSHICLDDCHKVCIENYYGDIVTAIKNAESFLPKTNPCIHRSFWTDELTDLNHASLECTNFWKQCGRPNTGPVFQCKKNCYYRYKIALRKEKLAAQKKISDDMYNDLLNRDNISFICFTFNSRN